MTLLRMMLQLMLAGRRRATRAGWLLALGAALVLGLAAPAARAGSCSVETWEQLRLLGYGQIRQIAYSPDDQRIAVASGIGVVLWNEQQEQVERTLTGHTSAVLSVA